MVVRGKTERALRHRHAGGVGGQGELEMVEDKVSSREVTDKQEWREKPPLPFTGGRGEEECLHVKPQKRPVFHGRPGMEEERKCISCEARPEMSFALSRVGSPKGPPRSTLRCLGKPRNQQMQDNCPYTPVISVQSRAKKSPNNFRQGEEGQSDDEKKICDTTLGFGGVQPCDLGDLSLPCLTSSAVEGSSFQSSQKLMQPAASTLW